MLYYKFTTAHDRSFYGDCQWGAGVTHAVEGPLIRCSNGIHVYTDPLVGLFLNPTHADIHNPHIWEGEAQGDQIADATKIVVRRFTALRMMNIPEPTTVQRVAFGILCAREMYTEPFFAAWAESWLSKQDRSSAAAARLPYR